MLITVSAGVKLESIVENVCTCLAVDEDFIREIAIKRMREGDKKAGKVGKGNN